MKSTVISLITSLFFSVTAFAALERLIKDGKVIPVSKLAEDKIPE
jgi:hypothetical protein